MENFFRRRRQILLGIELELANRQLVEVASSTSVLPRTFRYDGSFLLDDFKDIRSAVVYLNKVYLATWDTELRSLPRVLLPISPLHALWPAFCR
jgi:hypothetical protein